MSTGRTFVSGTIGRANLDGTGVNRRAHHPHLDLGAEHRGGRGHIYGGRRGRRLHRPTNLGAAQTSPRRFTSRCGSSWRRREYVMWVTWVGEQPRPAPSVRTPLRHPRRWGSTPACRRSSWRCSHRTSAPADTAPRPCRRRRRTGARAARPRRRPARGCRPRPARPGPPVNGWLLVAVLAAVARAARAADRRSATSPRRPRGPCRSWRPRCSPPWSRPARWRAASTSTPTPGSPGSRRQPSPSGGGAGAGRPRRRRRSDGRRAPSLVRTSSRWSPSRPPPSP